MRTEKPSAGPTETPLPTQIPKEAKKTMEECLRGLLAETPENLQAEYFREGSMKYNMFSDWKDAKGRYCCPTGYEICYMPTTYDVMAAQQMPQELLDKIGTENLFQFIRRKDSEEVVHRFYMKYSKAERSKYTKNREVENYQKGYKGRTSDIVKQERFQITEGLEWFYRYKNGKKYRMNVVWDWAVWGTINGLLCNNTIIWVKGL